MSENRAGRKTTPSHWKETIARLPGELAVCSLDQAGKLEFVCANDHFCALLAPDKAAGLTETPCAIMDALHPEDLPKLLASLQKAAADSAETSVDVRFLTKPETYCWFNIKASVAEKIIDKTTWYLLFTNVEAVYRANLLAEESHGIIDIAAKSGDMALWVYHLDNHHITQSFAKGGENPYGLPIEVEGGYEEVIRAGSIHPDDVEAYRAMHRKINDGAETGECTVRIYLVTERKYQWRHMTLSRTHDELGRPIAIGFGVNVELQKEAEIRFERETRLRKELMKDAVIYYRINLTNHRVEEIHSECFDCSRFSLPVSIEKLMAGGLIDGCYEADRELLSNALNPDNMLRNYESGKRGESITYRRTLPGKGLRWLKASIAKLKRVDTDDVIAFYTAIDIDDEMKERILYRDVINEEIESLVTMKVQTKEIRVLKENRRIHSHGTLVGDLKYFKLDNQFRTEFLSDVVPQDRESTADFTFHAVLERLQKQPILQHVFSTRGRNGEIRRKKIRVFYLDETKQDIVLVRRDITDLHNEQLRQNAALEKAVNETKAANAAKSVFLSQMSHDMRTPLNAIIGYSGMTLRQGATEAQKDEYLDDIHASGEYLLGIINDVLDMSKIESNKMVLHPEQYAFSEFKQNVETVILPLCEKKGVTFQITASKQTDAPLLVDRVRFNQIFINILSNAVKFTPAGGSITMSADCIGCTQDRVEMEFKVSDTGCGMSKEFIPHAFDSFTQEYSAQSMHKEQGTGLGLSIVKQLVELMDGTIDVESELGKGTSFIVRIPIRVLSGEEIAPKEEIPVHSLEGCHILLCEDHPMNRKIAVKLLEKVGCSVDTAEDGLVGVSRFESSAEYEYDAILMDVRMPNVGGLEAAKAIRSLPREDAADVPIIAMTANAFMEDRRESREAGMNAHLSKPVDPQEMYRVLYRYTSKRHVKRTPKILIVDDIEMNAALVAKALQGHYETIIALSAEQALAQLADNPYIVAVITDVQMPEMDGRELIRAIRRNDAYKRVALIANTQFGDSRMEEQMMKNGADDFIYKPTAPSVILSRVENVLGKYR